jgi:Na+-driven multidrug efflux pump
MFHVTVFTCSGMFQAMGNTVPSLLTSGSRVISFVLPALWLSTQPWFEIRHLWYVSVLSVTLQAVLVWFLLGREMKARLQ